ncbi:hypothetical protein B296_00050635 [Ensete ventricosum]|uniref:Uncharacterized protein n=1 Tax=Ensete ventricosum TaxID=4639 RepID=A0A426XUF5_ENSVE|nr:hypothetical protein B296_00050635 [Ensete ventricosum]
MGPPFRLDDLDAFGDRRANRHRRMGWFPNNTPQWTVRRGLNGPGLGTGKRTRYLLWEGIRPCRCQTVV